jgi:NAD-dependent dihydropyrimidine dehydrogenase PreA subunit
MNYKVEVPDDDYYRRIGEDQKKCLVNNTTCARFIDTSELDPEQAAKVEHCPFCPVHTQFDSENCVLCGGCIDVCPENCLIMVSFEVLQNSPELQARAQSRYGDALDLSGEGTAIIKDETICTRCGLCADRCPTNAVTMVPLTDMEELVNVK